MFELLVCKLCPSLRSRWRELRRENRAPRTAPFSTLTLRSGFPQILCKKGFHSSLKKRKKSQTCYFPRFLDSGSQEDFYTLRSARAGKGVSLPTVAKCEEHEMRCKPSTITVIATPKKEGYTLNKNKQIETASLTEQL